MLLAQQAVGVSPIPQAVTALREAIDASPVRLALPDESTEQCGYQSGLAAAYSPKGDRIAETMCTGDVVVLDAATGHVVFRRHLSAQASAVAYDPISGDLAVGTDKGIDLLDPSNGSLKSQLLGHGEANALAFSPDGELARGHWRANCPAICIARHPQGIRRWVPRCCASTLPQVMKLPPSPHWPIG